MSGPRLRSWGAVATAAAPFLLAVLLAWAPTAVEPGEELSGGEATVFDDGPNAFGRVAPGTSYIDWLRVREGKHIFLQTWESRRSVWDAESCGSCHFKDGRGAPPDVASGAEPTLPLLRLSGDPVYGRQLQREGLHGGEGRFGVSWKPVGETLRRPVTELSDLAHGPLHPGTARGLRAPPSLIGLGLLEAVPEDEILAWADPEDRDGNGISGRPNRLRDGKTGASVVGRFGWKAAQPTIRVQTATAFAEDLGVTLAAGELTEHQLDRVVFYLKALAVPARRGWTEPEVIQGKHLFGEVGCASCHRPGIEIPGDTIRPYTDLLLHDMGADLADGVEEGKATGREWRTAPLWGLGLLETVSGPVGLLHDGRARTVEEAILWHGGEAAAARDGFRSLSGADRRALLAFLQSL